MKAYKIEIFVIDHENIGEEAIKQEIECANFGNDCISPSVKSIVCKDIGEWHDDHPLNKRKTADLEYTRLFCDQKPKDADWEKNNG